MKKNFVLKSLIILLFSILSIIILTNNVEASTAGLTATSTNVTTGSQVTVTASVTAGAWNLSLVGAGQTKGLVGQTNTTDNSSSSVSITFTPTSAGEYKFTLTGDVTDYITDATDKINKSITITAKAPESNNNTGSSTGNATGNSTNNNTSTPVAKSSEARLKNLGINPNDFSGFKKEQPEYSVEVPNDVSKVKVYAEAVDKNAKISGVGDVSLKEGDNTVKVTVTAEDGKTTKTYTITIKRRTESEEDAQNGEARLSQLGIKPEEYDFSGFQKDKTEYSTEVPNEVDEIEVYAKAVDSNAQITGTGMIELKEGENELKIEVIAKNGTKQIYTINVTRKVAEITSNAKKFGLSDISIEGLTLTPGFMTGTYEYSVDLAEDLQMLEIETVATEKDAIVEIVGNENLQEGENTITILVQSKDKEKSATYQIVVNKKLQSEMVETSWLKPSTWGKEEKIKLAIIVVLVILIISAIMLKIKIAKEDKPDNKLDLPGAEELDKAITEHQVLADESMLDDGAQNESFEEPISDGDDTDNHADRLNSGDFKTENYIEDIAKDRFGVDESFGMGQDKPRRRGKHF